jgi:hypothetical protein
MPSVPNKIAFALVAGLGLASLTGCKQLGPVGNYAAGVGTGYVGSPVIDAAIGAASRMFNQGAAGNGGGSYGSGYGNGGYQQQPQQSGRCIETNDYDSYTGQQLDRTHCHSTTVTPYNPQY